MSINEIWDTVQTNFGIFLAPFKKQFEDVVEDYEKRLRAMTREKKSMKKQVEDLQKRLEGKKKEVEALRLQVDQQDLQQRRIKKFSEEDESEEEESKQNVPLYRNSQSQRKRMHKDASLSSVEVNVKPHQKRRRTEPLHSGSRKLQLFPPQSPIGESNSRFQFNAKQEHHKKTVYSIERKFDTKSSAVITASGLVRKSELIKGKMLSRKVSCDSTLDGLSMDEDDGADYRAPTKVDQKDSKTVDPEETLLDSQEPASMALYVNDLSPPSSRYDASKAIRNAVNHNDIAQMDDSMIPSDSSLSSVAAAGKSVQQNRRKRFQQHQFFENKNYRQMSITGAGFKKTVTVPKVDLTAMKRGMKSQKNFQDLDDTSIDLTFNSELDLTLGGSPSQRPAPPAQPPSKPMATSGISKPPTNLTNRSKRLPSLGGSPTEQGFKRPPPPNLPPMKHDSCIPSAGSDDGLVSSSSVGFGETDAPLATSTLKMPTQSSETQLGCSEQENRSPTLDIASAKTEEILSPIGAASVVFGITNPAPSKLPEKQKQSPLKPVNPKKNPKFNEDAKKSPAGHKYKSVERRKEERRNLPASWCYECYDYFFEKGLSASELEAKMRSGCSRHRARHPAPQTPENFWDLSFPPTQEASQNLSTTPTNTKTRARTTPPTNSSPKKKESTLGEALSRGRRRRPLCFPTAPGDVTDSTATSRRDMPPLAVDKENRSLKTATAALERVV